MFPKPEGIPKQSGCYLFRNEENIVIYVGKAKSLNSRLSSYFQAFKGLSPKTQFLMRDATSVEWIVTPSEIDALILENELIKQNQPRYNMRLKDDKSFPYVALDVRQPFPVPFTTRAKHHKGVRYFGPFVDVRALRTTMDEMLQAFPLRSCTKHKFDYQQRIGRPCLLYDIGKCSGPCVGRIDESGYKALVESWAKFFNGDVAPLRTLLTKQMQEASSLHHYEAAAKARDGIAALDRAAQSQVVVMDNHTNLDVLSTATSGGRAVVVRFRIRHGRIIGRSVHQVDRSMDESGLEITEGVLTELYGESQDVPPEVVVAPGVASELLKQYLMSVRKAPVTITEAQRGKKKALLSMALNDADAVMDRDSIRRQVDHNVRSRALQEIGEALNLPSPPYRMECFDMSHLQGTNYVGSMVVFEDGLPAKSQYRRFNVKTIVGNDDVGAMEEVVRRRLEHWGKQESGSKFRNAELVIIDGGLPQLHAAQKAADTAGVSEYVQFVALAKREELLYRPGSSEPIALERGSEALYMVQRIRDEAHRFAITFHRSKRAKAMTASSLEGVEGLGPKRRDGLLQEFGSLDAIRGASVAELHERGKIPEAVARSLYDHLQGPMRPKPEKGGALDG